VAAEPDARRAAFGAGAAIALAALAAAAAGLPLGSPGLAEEWSIRWAFDRGQPWIRPDVLSTLATRPLAALPQALGYALTPDSFVGDRIVLLVLLAGTAVAAAALLARLVPVPAAAAAGAVLALLAPADSAVFRTRDLPNHAAILFALLAILLLARAAEGNGAVAAAGMVVCECIALGLYDGPILVLLAAPALLPLLARGGKRASRPLVGLWLLAPAAFLVRGLVLLGRGGSYVTSLWEPGTESAGTRLLAGLGALFRMALRELAAPFLEGARALIAADRARLAAVLFAGAAAAVVLVRTRATEEPVRARAAFAAGLGLLVLGALPYAMAPALREETRRVHLLASLGSGIAFAAALGAVRRRAVPTIASVTLVALAVSAGRAQGEGAAAAARRVGALVRALAEGAPAPPPGTALLLLDADGPPPSEDVLGLTVTDVHLADALRVVHRQADLLVYVFGRDLRFRWNGTPEAGADGVTVRWADGSSALVPWEKVVLFREDAEGRVARADETPADLLRWPKAAAAGRAVPREGSPPPRLETLCPLPAG